MKFHYNLSYHVKYLSLFVTVHSDNIESFCCWLVCRTGVFGGLQERPAVCFKTIHFNLLPLGGSIAPGLELFTCRGGQTIQTRLILRAKYYLELVKRGKNMRRFSLNQPAVSAH